MSNVTLSIGGRTFTVSCADGEEQHVAELGRDMDERVQAMGATAGQNEVRMLLYCALTLADELRETRAAAPPTNADPAADARLSRIAETLENLATRLESRGESP